MIELKGICKGYVAAGVMTPILKNIDLFIGPGEFVSIMGPSGSGKSTLSSILGCLSRPNSGSYRLNGHEITTLGERSLALLRNRWIGFIFQDFNLLEGESAVENVALPLLYAGVPPRERRRRAIEALEAVDLANRMEHTPRMLSGGQKQRVAIARALVSKPAFLFADEPTGALDKKTGAEILGLMQRLNLHGHTIVQVTHSAHDAQHGKRIISLVDGLLVKDAIVERPLMGSFGAATGERAHEGRKRLWQVASKLEGEGEAAFQALVSLFRGTGDPRVLSEIPKVLVRFDRPEAHGILSELAGCADWTVRAEVIKALSSAPSTPVLLRIAGEALVDANPWVRFLALAFWKQRPDTRDDPGIRSVVLGMVQDKDERIRATSIAAIGLWRDPHSLQLLMGALQDPDARVRANAIEGLHGLLSHTGEDARILAALLPFLESPQNRVRGNAVAALVGVRPREAFECACRMMVDQNNLMRSSGAWALGEIGTEEAGTVLVRLLSGESEETVVQQMVASLSRISRKRTLPLERQIEALLDLGPILQAG